MEVAMWKSWFGEPYFQQNPDSLTSGWGRQYIKLLGGAESYPSDPPNLIYGGCKLEAPPPKRNAQWEFLSKKTSIGRLDFKHSVFNSGFVRRRK